MNDSLISIVSDSYEAFTGFKPSVCTKLTGSASNRHYYKVSGIYDIVATIGTSLEENQAFIYLSQIFKKKNINIPEVLYIDEKNLLYLQEYLGETSLYELIKKNGFNDQNIEYCKKALLQLAKIQTIDVNEIDFNYCYPIKKMDETSIKWDLNYFKYCFLKLTAKELDEPALEKDFNVLVEKILTSGPYSFIHRDFQSRNIMIRNNEPWIIDFQGGRYGPTLYDAVSFLWQARINIPHEIKQQLLHGYIYEISHHFPILNSIDTSKALNLIILFRMLQVLGAYGYRGLIERKEEFKTPIAKAIDQALEALDNLPEKFPYLHKVLYEISTFFHADDNIVENNPALTITITSFSYKKSLPEDKSGNGGGFIFDCRGLQNPGRYLEYKELTGNDQPVIDFLSKINEVDNYFANCKELVDITINQYLKRGFTHLSVAFGCTGGQHRSVYLANKMACHINTKYGIKVILNHREQGITSIIHAQS